MKLRIVLIVLLACAGALLAPAIASASVIVGQVLSTTTGGWANTPTSFSYQWEDCDSSGATCIFIAGANSQRYTVATADIAHTIRVIVTAANATGSGSVTSSQTVVVTSAGGAAPSNTVAPAATGTATQGQVLTTDHGTWTNSPTGYTQIWQDCDAQINCSTISGASATTYTLTAADVNHTVRSVVSATNASGTGSASSNLSAVIASSNAGGTGGAWNGSAETGLSTTTCSKYASTTGSDGNPGTLALPYATVQKLSDNLSAGQTGCVRGGNYNTGSLTVHRQTKFQTSGVTVTAYPGEAVTIHGFPWVTATNVTLSYLNFDLDDETLTQNGWCAGNANLSGSGGNNWWVWSMLLDTGSDGAVITHDNIYDDPSDAYFRRGQAIASFQSGQVTISFDRLHDVSSCQVEQHGVYDEHNTIGSSTLGDGEQIFDNWMYDIPGGFGVQFWDHEYGGHMYSNVVDQVSSCMTISSSGGDIKNTLAEHNVCANMLGLSGTAFCALSGCTGPDPGVLDSGFGPAGTNNVVRNNDVFCDSGFTHCTTSTAGATGVTLSGNVTSNPQFSDASYASTHDYRVNPTSPASGWGLWSGDFGSAVGGGSNLMGSSNVGATATTGMDADSKRAMCYAAGASGTVSRLTVYLLGGSATGTQKIQGVMYSSSAGAPAARLGVTGELTFSSGEPAGWYDLTFGSPVSVTSGTTYCEGIITGQTAHVAAFRWDAGQRYVNTNAYTSGASDPFAASGPVSTDTQQMSLYSTIQ